MRQPVDMFEAAGTAVTVTGPSNLFITSLGSASFLHGQPLARFTGFAVHECPQRYTRRFIPVNSPEGAGGLFIS